MSFESYRTGQVVFESDQTIGRVFFPLSGIVSLVAPIDSGKQQELCMVGREGMVGVALALGVERLPYRAVCQSPVTILSLHAADYREVLTIPAFSAVMQRYAEFRLIELVRIATCKHLVQQRFARWILTASDRLHADTFPLTHAAIARLLDVRRPGITEVAHRLQTEGVIEYASSEVTICNARALERFACDCYARVRAELDRFLRFAKNRPAY